MTTTLWAGVDLGGTTLSAALGDAVGTVVAERTIATESHAGPADVLRRMGRLLQELAETASATIAGLGVGMPGLVDVPKGVTRFLPNLPTQWRDVPAAALLRDQLGCPVQLLNDVRTATLGELKFGRGRDVLNMAFFSLGTGVGGGVVIDGRLRLGPLGAAGELGHQTMLPTGAECGCGNRGCLETLVSGPALIGEATRLMKTGLAPQLYQHIEGDCQRVTPATIGAAAQAGDRALINLLRERGEWLGIGMANVVTILHPELIVVGGGVAELGDWLIEPARHMLHQRVGMFPTQDVRVERSLLGPQAGVRGALALAMFGVSPTGGITDSQPPTKPPQPGGV